MCKFLLESQLRLTVRMTSFLHIITHHMQNSIQKDTSMHSPYEKKKIPIAHGTKLPLNLLHFPLYKATLVNV